MLKILASFAAVRAFVAPVATSFALAVQIVRDDPIVRLVILSATTLSLVGLARVLPFWPYAPIGTAAVVLLNRVLSGK